MALKLRRGTNAQRLGITFAEGELVYITDSKKLYIGDGASQGGNLVSGMNNLLEDQTPQLGGNLDLNGNNIIGTGNVNITGSLTVATGFLAVDIKGSVFANDSGLLVDGIAGKHVLSNNALGDLGNVAATVPTNGQVLKWSGTTWTPSDDSVTPNLALDGLSNVSAASPTQNQALVWNGSAWVPGDVVQQGEFLDGDFRGSLFGDDSTLIVDGISNVVTASSLSADTINSPSGVFRLNGPNAGVFTKTITSNNERYYLELKRKESSVLRGTNTFTGAIKFTVEDSNEYFVNTYQLAFVDRFAIGHHTTSTATSIDSSGYLTIANGNLCLGQGLGGIGTERLDVTGNGKFTGFVQFGSYTTAQRNALTAANGMVIYNSTTNKFQGSANGAWVDLH